MHEPIGEASRREPLRPPERAAPLHLDGRGAVEHAGAGGGVLAPVRKGFVDVAALRQALADEVATAVVVDHPDGRDGMGEVAELGRLSAVLDALSMCDGAELITPTRVLRLVRAGDVAVIAEFSRRPDVLARLDDVLPVDLDASEHPTEPAGIGQDDWSRN